MPTGKIQSIAVNKGFGFVRPEDGGPDLFFHRSAVRGEFTALRPGMPVTYEQDEAAEKPRASSVQPAQSRPGRPPDSGGRATGTRRTGREQRPVRPTNCQRGFVTKLRREEPHGYISADAGGTEIRFEPGAVRGEKRFEALQVGDYVEFVVRAETAGTKSPEANYVCVIERTIRFPRTNLTRHPRARGKKPSWR
jgi:CspA family cold shock protein